MAKVAGVAGVAAVRSDPAVGDPSVGDPAVVYRLRIMVAGISPLIWRRLLVPGDATIAELHTVVQTVFGWGGEHLHRFVIHGTEYGISCVGGPGLRHNARGVRLGDLGLRLGERFSYDDNFTAGWRVELRVEQIAPREPRRVYPRCVGGRRAGPPEEWDGPWAFAEQTQPHLVFAATVRAAQIVGRLLDADGDDIVGVVLGEDLDELAALTALLGLERFDRRACNTALTAATAAATKESRA